MVITWLMISVLNFPFTPPGLEILPFSILSCLELRWNAYAAADDYRAEDFYIVEHRGMVVDRTGKPVSKAKVIAYGEKEYPIFPPELVVLGETQTNENGIFTISEKWPEKADFDNKYLWAHKKGFSLGWVEYYEVGESPESAIVLEKPAILAGKVVDERGYPVDKAEVHAMLFCDKHPIEKQAVIMSVTDMLTARTNGYGEFVFENIPQNMTADLVAYHDDFIPTFTWLPYAEREKGTFEAGARDVVITMKKAGSLNGSVVNMETGQPMPDFLISMSGRPQGGGYYANIHRITDRQGRFSINYLPGTYKLDLVSKARKHQDTQLAFDQKNIMYVTPFLMDSFSAGLGPLEILDDAWSAQPVNAEIIVGQTTNVTLRAEKNALLEIHVIQDKDDRPLSMVVLNVKKKNTPESWSRSTPKEGVVRFRLPAGEYIIEKPEKTGYESMDKDQEVTLLKEGEHRVKFQLKQIKTINVKVGDSKGIPLDGVEVYVMPSEGLLGITDAAGEWNLPREYIEHAFSPDVIKEWKVKPSIIFRDKNRNLGAIYELEDKKEFNITLPDGFIINGQVIDESGMPIAQAEVYLEYIDEFGGFSDRFIFVDTVVADAEGKYQFKAVPKNNNIRFTRYRLKVDAGENFGQSESRLSYTRDMTRQQALHTQENREKYGGHYPINPNVLYADEDRINVAPVVVRKSDLSISGVVVDCSGNPVPNAQVNLRGESQAEFEPAITDSQGRFMYKGLCAGKIMIEIVPTEELKVLHNIYFHAAATVEAGTEDIRIMINYGEKCEEPPNEGGLIEILVRDEATQKPISGAYVYIRSEHIANSPKIYTDNEGRACLVLPAGKHLISSVSKWDYVENKLRKQIEVSNGQKYRIDCTMNSLPSYNGNILDQNGKPLGGARMQLVPAQFAMKADDFQVITNADGKFNFTWNPGEAFKEAKERKSGVYLVVAQERLNLAATFELTENSYSNWDITLEPGPAISGVITNSSGHPVKEANISYEIRDQLGNCLYEHTEIKSNSKGEYLIPALPFLPKGYIFSLDVINAGYRTLAADIEIPAELLMPGETFIKDIIVK